MVVLTLHVVGDLGQSYADAGALSAVFTIAVALASPLRGRLLDTLGLRRTLLPSLVLLPVGFLAAPFLGYWALMGVMAGVGLLAVPWFVLTRQLMMAAVPRAAASGARPGLGRHRDRVHGRPHARHPASVHVEHRLDADHPGPAQRQRGRGADDHQPAPGQRGPHGRRPRRPRRHPQLAERPGHHRLRRHRRRGVHARRHRPGHRRRQPRHGLHGRPGGGDRRVGRRFAGRGLPLRRAAARQHRADPADRRARRVPPPSARSGSPRGCSRS